MITNSVLQEIINQENQCRRTFRTTKLLQSLWDDNSAVFVTHDLKFANSLKENKSFPNIISLHELERSKNKYTTVVYDHVVIAMLAQECLDSREKTSRLESKLEFIKTTISRLRVVINRFFDDLLKF